MVQSAPHPQLLCHPKPRLRCSFGSVPPLSLPICFPGCHRCLLLGSPAGRCGLIGLIMFFAVAMCLLHCLPFLRSSVQGSKAPAPRASPVPLLRETKPTLHFITPRLLCKVRGSIPCHPFSCAPFSHRTFLSQPGGKKHASPAVNSRCQPSPSGFLCCHQPCSTRRRLARALRSAIP